MTLSALPKNTVSASCCGTTWPGREPPVGTGNVIRPPQDWGGTEVPGDSASPWPPRSRGGPSTTTRRRTHRQRTHRSVKRSSSSSTTITRGRRQRGPQAVGPSTRSATGRPVESRITDELAAASTPPYPPVRPALADEGTPVAQEKIG